MALPERPAEERMKHLLASAALFVSIAGTASAANVGVSMALFDDNFLTVLRNGMPDVRRRHWTASTCRSRTRRTTSPSSSTRSTTSSPRASTRSSSTRSTPRPPRRCRDAAAAAGVPLVYVNREPINVDTLPDNQAFVASNEVDSGTLETKEVCRLLKEAGKTEANVYVIMGELSNQAAVQRTAGHPRRDRRAGDCGVTINIIDEQTSNWRRDEAQNLMTNWLSTGTAFDARHRQQRRDGDRRDPGDEGGRHRHGRR